MNKRWMMIAMLTVAACGTKKSKQDGDGTAKAESGSIANTGSGAKVDEADLFTGQTVALPTPAAKLRFGMTEAEAKAAAPELFAKPYGYDVPGTEVKYNSTKIAVQMSKGRVWNIRAELLQSQDAAKVWLTKKWGEPIARKNSIGTPEYYWIAPAAGMHAKLEQRATASTVYFSQIMPRDQLLGSDPKHFGFEPSPLIGMTKDDAMKALAAYSPAPRDSDPDSIVAQFLPIESGYDNIGSSIDLRVKQGKVTGYTFSFAAGDAKDVDAFVAKLEAMYGKGKPDSTGLYTDYPGPGKPKAELPKGTDFSCALWLGDH